MRFLFKFFQSKAGKVMLSGTQALAASAAVGLGCVAAWQILGSDSNSDNAFNSLGYQPQEEVVYVSGAATGQYGLEDHTESAFRAAPSKAIEMQQREAEYLRQQELEREAAERAAYEAQTSAPAVDANPIGGINEGLGNKKMEAFSPEQIKAMQAQALQQAQAAASAGKAQADAIAAAAASGVSGAATRSGALGAAYGGGTMAGSGLSAGAGGSAQYVGMPGTVDSGKNLNGSDGITTGTDAVYLPEQEGARIPNARNQRAKPSFGADVKPRENSKDFNSLELMAKRSAEIAGNETRSANEAGRAFMASTKNSGGIRLDGVGEVSVGQGASSDDFGDASLSGINGAVGSAMEEIMTEEEQFRQERKDLRKKLRKLIGYTFIAFACAFPFLGWLAVRGKFNEYYAAAEEYDKEYGDRSKEAKAGKKIANKLKICAKAGGFGLVLFGAMIPWMLADAFGWTTSVDKLKAEDDSAEQGRVGSVRGSSSGNEPGSTLDVTEGSSASDASSRRAQEYMTRTDGR